MEKNFGKTEKLQAEPSKDRGEEDALLTLRVLLKGGSNHLARATPLSAKVHDDELALCLLQVLVFCVSLQRREKRLEKKKKRKAKRKLKRAVAHHRHDRCDQSYHKTQEKKEKKEKRKKVPKKRRQCT